jgi:organic radical activating enzyme
MADSYKISEIFFSLQGEGARAGTPNIFIRFAHCNLTCNFCDTEFESFTEMTKDQLHDELLKYPCTNLILTGGEPLLQVDQDLVDYLHTKGYFLCLETNGSMKPPTGIDHIVCSPKVAEHVVKQNFHDGVHELKYVRHTGQSIPVPQVKAEYYYLSPQAVGDLVPKDNLAYCIELVKQHPEWRLTVQNHKLWKVR